MAGEVWLAPDGVTLCDNQGRIIPTGASGSVVSVDGATGAVVLSGTYQSLATFVEDVQDAIGGMVTGNTETNITVTYDDATGKLNFVASGGAGVSDGDKGDVVVSGGGTVWTVDLPQLAEGTAINMVTGSGLTTVSVDMLDEDAMTSNSDTQVPSQQSVKAYADSVYTLAVAVSQPLTPAVGTALATTGTVNLDLSALNGTVQWITATGNITFTTSNRAAGRHVRLFIDAGGSTRTLAYPSWTAHGAALPTSLASGKRLALSLMSLGTTDANISAAASAQP
jgi:hypothetical protein